MRLSDLDHLMALNNLDNSNSLWFLVEPRLEVTMLMETTGVVQGALICLHLGCPLLSFFVTDQYLSSASILRALLISTEAIHCRS